VVRGQDLGLTTLVRLFQSTEHLQFISYLVTEMRRRRTILEENVAFFFFFFSFVFFFLLLLLFVAINFRKDKQL
jgi:hypothetical protein